MEDGGDGTQRLVCLGAERESCGTEGPPSGLFDRTTRGRRRRTRSDRQLVLANGAEEPGKSEADERERCEIAGGSFFLH